MRRRRSAERSRSAPRCGGSADGSRSTAICCSARENDVQRPSWQDYFTDITRLVASRCTCRRRKVGSILVKNKRILATGYNGAPSGVPHCLDVGCLREELGMPSGERHELCRGLHAEQNAILQAAHHGVSIDGADIYCTNLPCVICCQDDHQRGNPPGVLPGRLRRIRSAARCCAPPPSTWCRCPASPRQRAARREGRLMRCPFCGKREDQRDRLPGVSGGRRDSAPARVRGVRAPLHHLRAGRGESCPRW